MRYFYCFSYVDFPCETARFSTVWKYFAFSFCFRDILLGEMRYYRNTCGLQNCILWSELKKYASVAVQWIRRWVILHMHLQPNTGSYISEQALMSSTNLVCSRVKDWTNDAGKLMAHISDILNVVVYVQLVRCSGDVHERRRRQTPVCAAFSARRCTIIFICPFLGAQLKVWYRNFWWHINYHQMNHILFSVWGCHVQL